MSRWWIRRSLCCASGLELCTAASLSQLWQQQGKCTEAYELLAPVYGWCIVGCDTTALQEAKALLVELGRSGEQATMVIAGPTLSARPQ